jgi:hypothetical protein
MEILLQSRDLILQIVGSSFLPRWLERPLDVWAVFSLGDLPDFFAFSDRLVSADPSGKQGRFAPFSFLTRCKASASKRSRLEPQTTRLHV